MKYIKLFEHLANTRFNDGGIKVIHFSDYQRNTEKKDLFNRYEIFVLNKFINSNHKIISGENFDVDCIGFQVPSKLLKIGILSQPNDTFNICCLCETGFTANYYQCDEIESVIRLLNKILK